MTPRSKEAFEAMRETTRQKIETATLALFARKGLSVTVGEIAKAAGVSNGLLYSHYPSKEALIAELARKATAISGLSIKDIADGDGSALQKVDSVVTVMCAMFKDYPIGIDYFIFMLQVGMSDFEVPESLYSQEVPNPLLSLAKIIVQGQAEGSVVDGDPQQLSLLFWGTIEGLCCYAIIGVPVLPDPVNLKRILIKEKSL